MLFTSPHTVKALHEERISDGIRAAKRKRMIEEIECAQAVRGARPHAPRGMLGIIRSLLTPSMGSKRRLKPNASGAKPS